MCRKRLAYELKLCGDERLIRRQTHAPHERLLRQPEAVCEKGEGEKG